MNNYFKNENKKERVTLGEILDIENMMKKEIDKMVPGFDEELDEIFKDFELDEVESSECPPVYNDKEKVAFEDSHDDLDKEMEVVLNTEEEHVLFEGTVKFIEPPNPKNEVFKFKIVINDIEVDAEIDRYAIECDTLLKDGDKYAFRCSGKDVFKILYYKSFSSGIYGINFGDFDETLDDIDEKIFTLECIERECENSENNYGVIKVEIKGNPRKIIENEGVKEFDVLYNKIKHHCIFDLNLNHLSKKIVIDEKKEYVFGGVLIADKVYIREIYENDKHVKKIETTENSVFAKAFTKLSDSQKAEIIHVMENCMKNDLVESDEVPAFVSRTDMERKYTLIKEYYPKEVQKAIDITLKSQTIRGNQRDMILGTLINAVWGQKLKIESDYNFLKSKLDERFYGQEYLKNEIIKIILSYKYKKERKGISVLLVGSPGVGKTSMFKYAAKIAGMPFEKISLNGIDVPYYIKGTPRLYENAAVGQVMEAIRKHGDRCMIMLDEVDKMTEGKEGNPMTSLYDLLDPNELFVDNLIATGIDLSNVIFVLTANDASVLPTPIIDRVNEIFVPDYTEEEKKVIAKDYVIKEEVEKYDLESKKIIWDESAIDDIANKYTLTNGVRDIERNVASIVRNALYIMVKDKIEEIVVSEDNVENLLDIAPCRRDDIVHEIASLRNKFKHFKYSYSDATRKDILSLFAKYDAIKDTYEREVIRKKLDFLVNCVPDKSCDNFDLRKIKEKLDCSHYGMDEVKGPILSYIATRSLNSAACAKCLWLDGPYGVGKTTICRTIAEAMNRKFIKISLNGVEKSGFLKGFESTWKDATAGKIIEELSKAGTDKVVILLDEIDKMSKSSNNGEPYSALLDLLDDSATFTDLFVGIPIDVSNVLFIATSNEASDVPASIRDRMEMVQLHGYTENEKIHIAEEFVMKKKLDKYMIKDKVFSDETIKNIVSTYCKSYGVRDIDAAIDKVLREYIKEVQLGNMLKEIDDDFVRKILGAKPLKRGNVADESIPGMARALAVSGNTGTTFAIQVSENPYGKADEVTGLPKQSTLDSIKISKLLISKMLQKELPMLHVHFGEGGIEKDGPSAGITIFSAMYSCLTGIDIDRKIGMTGEIDIFGSVWPIGGLELKITAAENEGCTRVLVPIANYQQLVEEDKLGKYKCEIVPVSNVQEVCNLLFEGCSINK